MVTSGRVLGPPYDDADVAALVADVLPKYFSFFVSLMVDRMILAPGAVVLTLGPAGSSIIDDVVERLPSAVIHAFEPSDAGVRAALERTSSLDVNIELGTLESLPIRRSDATFTHSLAVHPISAPSDRLLLIRELLRVLIPAGQLLFALPLRGSFPEIADMLREFSLKHDLPDLAEAIEIAALSRPTPETLSEELESAGFVDITVDVELLSVPFESGKDFAQHPLFRLVVAPHLISALGLPPERTTPALAYIETAVTKYWSEGQFDLTVNLGCASARRPSPVAAGP